MNHAHGRVWIKLEGERVTVAEACRRLHVSPMGMWNRLKRGVSREKLLAPGYGPRKVEAVVKVETVVAEQPRPTVSRHPFIFFRVGQDICGRCGKTRREHG